MYPQCAVLSCSVVSDSLWPHGLQPARLLCPWDSPGKNTGVGCHALLQGIFPTQGSNPGLLHCRWILYQLSYQGSPLSTIKPENQAKKAPAWGCIKLEPNNSVYCFSKETLKFCLHSTSWRLFHVHSERFLIHLFDCPRLDVGCLSAPTSCFVAPWWMQSVLFPSASVDHLHLPPTPPSSNSSDSEGSLSPSPRLHPFGLPQTHSPARAPARAPSALASSPLLTAPHVSVPASLQPDPPILSFGASPRVAAIPSHLAFLPLGSFQFDC